MTALAIFGISGLWGHQVIAEHQAKTSYTTARGNLIADISTAQNKQGLFASEMKKYSSALDAILAASPPQDANFWSTATGSFYSRQTNRLDSLDNELQARVSHVLTYSRKHADFLVWKFGRDLHKGKRRA